MAKYTKKWQKEFEKRYSAAILEIKNLEVEYNEMKETNPDEFGLDYIIPKEDTISLGEMDSYGIYELQDAPDGEPYADFNFNFKIAKVNFRISKLKDLIGFRNELIELIDRFDRPVEQPKAEIDTDDCEDEDGEEQEWTIKAEQPLTQSWTYTVTAKSACAAIKMLEEDPDQDGIVNNDDNEYYDYGETEYDTI